MLDKRCLALLEYINCECQSSAYKIFAVDEFVSAMPSHFLIDKEGVRECIRNLSQHEYISVKYEDESEVCLTPLTKGRLVFENKLDEEISRRQSERKYFAYSAFGGFLGGFVSGIIVLIVMALIGRG